MSTTEPDPRQSDPRQTISDRYGRFYAPLAIGSVLLAFLPLFEDVDFQRNGFSLHSTYGSVFDMARRPGGGPAMIGLILLIGLVALLSLAAVRIRSAAIPSCLAVLAALIALMLLIKPGTGDPTPPLTDSGLAGLVLTSCVVVIAVAHAVQLTTIGRRS